MEVIYLLVPLALALAVAAVWAFAWSVRSGDLDDLETPPLRMLFDEDPTDQAGAPRGGGAR